MKTNPLKVADAALWMDETGTGDELVLFVHGWCCRRTDWRETLVRPAPGRRLVALDLPGHGESHAASVPQWSVRGLAQVVAAAAEQLGAGAPVTLVGHSMGGAVALEAGRLLPRLAGVVLVDTFVLPYGDIDETLAGQIETPFHQDFAAAMMKLVADTAGPALAPAARAELQRAMAAGADRCEPMLALWADLLRWSPMAAFAELTAPIAAINGDLIPAAARRRCVPFVRETVLAGTGHFPQLEMPAAFAAALDQALAGSR